MSDQAASVVSIFSRVDQAAMLERLAESPLEDAEIGFLTDRDAAGKREVSPSLLAGIHVFAGLDPSTDDSPGPSPEQAVQDPESPATLEADEGSRASFILFGPSGQSASSA